MHSLFLRIFTLFWVAMAIIVGGSIAITFTVAAREYEAPEFQRRPNAAIQASEVLARGGIGALKSWLDANKNASPDRDIYIIGPDGADILGRRLSPFAARRLEFINRDEFANREELANRDEVPAREGQGIAVQDAHTAPADHAASGDPVAPGDPAAPGDHAALGYLAGPGGHAAPGNAGEAAPRFAGRPPPGNFRPSRAAPQIVATDGVTYTVITAPRRPSIFGALSLPGISLTILCIALMVSALTSWWLAQHLSAPIRRIQEGARALASENLDVKVSAGLEGRKDELAVLARDFDAMAGQLRANRAATTQLLRDISHELRSPLARMRVALGLARQPPADLVRQLDRMEREIERLDALISQVLKLARLHGSEAQFTHETFELGEVIEEVVRDANFEGAVKGCKVLLQGTADASIHGNRELLRSAIENVLRNAVRYSPKDAAVELSVARTDGGLILQIQDRGPGVPPADLVRIFEPFYRVAESRDRDSGGEGIGLAITAQVMKAHGGSANAVNRTDGGLAVRLSLPRGAIAV